jgi:phytoene synthase
MTSEQQLGRQLIARHSKSFALAARLLAAESRDRVAALYAWCRVCDDAIDLSPPATHAATLAELQRELRSIYAGESQPHAAAALFQGVVRDRRIPVEYPAELLEGLRMDASGQTYASTDELLHYAFRVAGTVGLMMCHVFGVADSRAIVHAAHLGIAMQLTNIARDVAEDWQRRRLYLPGDLLGPELFSELRARLGGELPRRCAQAMAPAVAALLRIAEGYYASGDRGLALLDHRAALSVRTARLIYAAIGVEIARRHYDVLAGRAVVPARTKARLALTAVVQQVGALPERWRARQRVAVPTARLSARQALRITAPEPVPSATPGAIA